MCSSDLYTGKSLAMGLLDTDCVQANSALAIDVVGKRRHATILTQAAWDPVGQQMRL